MNIKKIAILLIFLFSIFWINYYPVSVNAEESTQSETNNTQSQVEEEYYFDKNCTDLAPALRIGGLVINFIKWIIPIIIVILGIISLFSAILKGGPVELGKGIIKLCLQIVIATLIFFTPSIVNTFVGVMTKDNNSDIDVCRMCLLENNCPVPEEEEWYNK